MKKLVATVAIAAGLLVPSTVALAEESCRVCVEKCGHSYSVYWYDLDGNYQLLWNGCIH